MFGKLLTLVFEVADFIGSAIASYTLTEEGAQDWAEVKSAWVEAGFLNMADAIDEDEGEGAAQSSRETVDEIISGENTSAGTRGARRIVHNRGGGVVGEVVD